MKLYQIPEGSKVYCECSDGSQYVIFNHIDGMYSHCTSENGEAVHLSASTPVVSENGVYRVGEEHSNNVAEEVVETAATIGLFGDLVDNSVDSSDLPNIADSWEPNDAIDYGGGESGGGGDSGEW